MSAVSHTAATWLKAARRKSFDDDPVGVRIDPAWMTGRREDFNRTVVGAIGSGLQSKALEYRDASSRGERPILDGSEIGRLAAESMTLGYRTYCVSLREMKATISQLCEAIDGEAGQVPLEDPIAPLEARTVQIVCERLRFTELNDPALVNRSVALMVEVRVADHVGSTETIMTQKSVELDVPTFDYPVDTVALDIDLGEIEVRQGND